MNEHFYYEGTQIKNYLIGFASVFSEIPYMQRDGKLGSVPIHYGSPSDIISYFEMNVDNEETHNRNRTKDISVPIFSFRMTGMERNSDRRRAPLDSIAVDLRPLGYSTGYIAMKPAPFKFTMELLLWAGSDYQAFEIIEQIVPYFNTPQQVTIEPLPRCPVSATEIHMESLDIDTDPESQKYSALATMTFTLTGWLLSQPRIWSTNMKFELSMLDKSNINNGVNLNDTDYSVGHEIIDTNFLPVSRTNADRSLDTVEDFIRLTPLREQYGDKLAWYDELVNAGRISEHGELLSHEILTIEYKGEEKILYPETIDMLIDDMEDVRFMYENEQLKKALSTHTVEDDLSVVNLMLSDDSNTIEVFSTLLDNNLVTRGFNRTKAELSNSEKLNLFGTSRVDVDGILLRMRGYLASLENLKIQKERIKASPFFNEPSIVFNTPIVTDIENIPEDFKIINGEEIDYSKSNIEYGELTFDEETNLMTIPFTPLTDSNENIKELTRVTITEEILNSIIDNTLNVGNIEIESINIEQLQITNISGNTKSIIRPIISINSDNNLSIKFTNSISIGDEIIISGLTLINPTDVTVVYSKWNEIITEIIDIDSINKPSITIPTTLNSSTMFNIVYGNPSNNIQGAYVTTEYSPPLSELVIPNTDILFTPNIEMSENYFKFFDPSIFLDDKFLNVDKYILVLMIYVMYETKNKDYDYYVSNGSDVDNISQSKIFNIFNKEYDIDIKSFIEYRNTVYKLIFLVSKDKNISINLIKDEETTTLGSTQGQHNISPDLATVLENDLDGNPIYDANGDGFIDSVDLDILGSNVENREEYDYELKYGIWYKRFRIENMTEDRVVRIMGNLKIIFYLTEKEDMRELKDYLILWKKGYVSSDFNIIEDEQKQQEIRALGYDLLVLDEKFLFLRLFVAAMRNILLEERAYIIYNSPDMREQNKERFYAENLEIDMFVMSKFIEQYFNNITNIDDKISDEELFREILPKPMGEYYDFAYKFNLIWADLKKTPMVAESVVYKTPWLDEQLPEVTEKLNLLNGED